MNLVLWVFSENHHVSETVPAVGEMVMDQTKALACGAYTADKIQYWSDVSGTDKAQEEKESKVRGWGVIGGAL